MAETTDTVRIVLRAIDEATGTLKQARQALDDNARAQDRAGAGQRRYNEAAVDGDRQTRRLNSTIERMTSVHGLAATGLARVQGLLVGMAFGAATAGFGALIAIGLEWGRSALGIAANQEKLNEAMKAGAAAARDQERALAALASARVRGAAGEEESALIDRGKALNDQIATLQDDLLAKESALRSRQQQVLQGGFQGIGAAFTNVFASDQAEIDRLRAHLGQLEAQRTQVLGQVGRFAPVEVPKPVAQQRAEELTLAQSTFEIEFAKIESAAREKHARDLGQIQEERGRQIVEAAQRELAERGAHQEALGKQIQDAARYELGIREEVEQRKAQAVTRFGQVMADSVAQAVLGQASLGKALRAGLAQTLASIAGEAAVRAIFETAMGFASLFVNPVKAAAHFKAAAIFGIVGIAAGAAGAKFAGGAGGAEGGGASPVSSVPAGAREIGPSASAQPLPQVVNIYIDGNLVDLSQLSRELRPYNIQLTKDTI